MKLDRSKFLREVKEHFPEIKEDINAEQGLLHLEVSVFYLFTQKLINEGNVERVKIAYHIADKYFRLGDTKMQNAIDVSYVEGLEFKNTKKNEREWAWQVLPSMLKAAYTSFHGKNGI